MTDTKDITQEFLLEILEYDKFTGIFTWKKKLSTNTVLGSRAGSFNSTGAEQIRINKKFYKSHRLAWLYCFGEWPNGQIDHINRNREDNRISNLRVVTSMQNCSNRKNNNKFIGVSWCETYRKWKAIIRIDGKNKYLGAFNTHIAACYARHQANIEINHKCLSNSNGY